MLQQLTIDERETDEQTSSAMPFSKTFNDLSYLKVKVSQQKNDELTLSEWLEPGAGYGVFTPSPVRVQQADLPANSSASTDTLNRFIALVMCKLPTVKRIYSKKAEGVFYTWIVIEQRDRDVLKLIYAREKEIIKQFPDCGFDFYVLYASGTDIDSLVSNVEQLFP